MFTLLRPEEIPRYPKQSLAGAFAEIAGVGIESLSAMSGSAAARGQ
jgi:hypothetical protein